MPDPERRRHFIAQHGFDVSLVVTLQYGLAFVDDVGKAAHT